MGRGVSSWFAWDLVGKVVIGVAVGVAVGWGLARIAFRSSPALAASRRAG